VRKIAMIARWKPVHLGHAAVLRALVRTADHVVLGIGSSNKRDVHNPFTAAETREMLDRVLSDDRARCTVLDVPDLGDPPRWRLMVREMLGPLDAFVTANAWVQGLMRDDYPVIHPVTLLEPRERVKVSGTMVRLAMARGSDWRALIPPTVADYLESHGLVERFVREFGLETLSLMPVR
jgi:nicotinamide-nucleotide adenylyltransferase